MLHHLLHPVAAVFAAGVFHAVGGDDEHGVLGHILFPGIFVDVGNVVDGPAQSIDQRGTAAGTVIPPGHGRHLADVHPVVQYLGIGVEKHRGHQHLSLPLSLPVYGGVEAADGIVGQAEHGAAHIDHKYQFRKSFFHFIFLRILLIRVSPCDKIIRRQEGQKVNSHATYFPAGPDRRQTAPRLWRTRHSSPEG